METFVEWFDWQGPKVSKSSKPSSAHSPSVGKETSKEMPVKSSKSTDITPFKRIDTSKVETNILQLFMYEGMAFCLPLSSFIDVPTGNCFLSVPVEW